ncbi:hypothetical protein E6W17_20270 [Streptomyces sp. A1547]|nr:hypothetical protein E6W17_20270 [Streptomyces sp. A1547]
MIGTRRAVCHSWTLRPPRHPGPGWPSSTGRRAGGSGGACDGVRPCMARNFSMKRDIGGE